MSGSGFWPTSLTDWAQVGGAIATAAAVVVTLYLARRDQRENLSGYIGFAHGRNAIGPVNERLQLTVTNCGVRPAMIEVAHLEYPSSFKRWGIFKHHLVRTFYFNTEDCEPSPPFPFGHSQKFSCTLTPDLVERVYTQADAARMRMIVETTTDVRVVIKPPVETARFILNYANKCREEVRKSAEDMGSETKIPQ